MKFLIIGCGSIGRRHAKNLKELGEEVIGTDIVPDNRKWMEENLGIKTFEELKDALRKEKPVAALVCTPPHLHVLIAKQALSAKAHVFIEKPISHDGKGVDALLRFAEKKKRIVAVGYNLRFHKGIAKLKELVDNGRVGKILSARMLFGQYLPNWRPTQDYRKSYTASKSMGGGIILDDSHEIDYARWLMGEVAEVSCIAAKVSNLEVETEDTADMTLKFKSGSIAQIHMDFVRQDYARNCELIGEKGTIRWDYTKGVIEIYDAATKQTDTIDVKCEPNEMYVDEIKQFIDCVRNNKTPLVNGYEGKKTLMAALAAKKSSEKGKIMRI